MLKLEEMQVLHKLQKYYMEYENIPRPNEQRAQ